MNTDKCYNCCKKGSWSVQPANTTWPVVSCSTCLAMVIMAQRAVCTVEELPKKDLSGQIKLGVE